jgi:hypothetical protein
MKTITRVFFTFLVLGVALPALRGAEAAERIAVPFSDPGKPGLVQVSLISGAITVKGYEGREVIIESRPRGAVMAASEPAENKHPGMKRLVGGGGGLNVEEDGNVMEIHVPAWKADIDLTIQVPTNASLKLHTINNGDIRVENVGGEIEAANVNGSIVLSRLSGPLTAHTVNGDVKAGYSRFDGKKPVSLVTLNGDIDLTLPADTKADLKMKIDNEGEIYSDFDLSVQNRTEKSVEDERDRGGRYHLRLDKTLFAALNGGGQEIVLKTFNGDILLRKAK